MMKRWLLVVALALPGGAAAQDTSAVERLRAEVERRFAERVRTELQLTDDQATRLKATQERFGPRRRDLMRQQLAHRMALQWQMRPWGTARDAAPAGAGAAAQA